MRKWFLGTLAVILCLGVYGCSTLLPNVDPKAKAPPPPPPVLGAFGSDPPISTASEWSERRVPILRDAFAANIYGPMPAPYAPRLLERRSATVDGVNARIEQWTVAVTDDPAPLVFNMVLVLPPSGDGPFPSIVMQNFCGNRAAFPGRPAAIARPLTHVLSACDDAKWDPVIQGIFGRHINIPPYADVLGHGYALAMFYAGDVVSDEAGEARPMLDRLDKTGKTGAIAAWAWLYSRAIDVLSADARLDPRRIALWGHSRNGKAALLAAAFDPRPAAVIAHQSGRGGAALNSGVTGETIPEMMKNYPHWFSPDYAAGAADPAFDQHQLIALIAPRPVLLGNGRRDAHADPIAAYRALQAADPVYGLFGSKGLDQTGPMERNLDADLAYVMRGGLHGVTSEDWAVFLGFLDAHFKRAEHAAK